MSLPPPPPGMNINENRNADLYGGAISTMLIAAATIALRFYCRKFVTGAKLWYDDWCIVIAFIFAFVVNMAIIGWMMIYGFGSHVWVADPMALVVYAKGLLLAELGYFFCIAAIKYSIMFFYWRLFGQDRKIRIPIYICAFMVTGWAVGLFFPVLLKCRPISAQWNLLNPFIPPEVKATFKCPIDSKSLWVGNAIPNIITDIFLILIPIPFIWKLKMSMAQKVAVGGVFLVGFFIVAISGIRLYYLFAVDLDSPDVTWNSADVGLWTLLELHIAIICANLPSLRPVLGMIFPSAATGYGSGTEGLKSTHNDRSRTPTSRAFLKIGGERTPSEERTLNGSDRGDMYDQYGQYNAQYDIEMNSGRGIKQTRTFTVESEMAPPR